MKQLRVICICIIALGIIQCGHDKEGPTPVESAQQPSIQPQGVCVEQLTTSVIVNGTGMSPMPIKVMEDNPQLALPGVTLIQTQDLEGAAVTGEPVVIPDDPAAPEASRLHWFSQEKMSFEVFPELSLATGLHTVQVTNPNDNVGQWPDALLAVPRPTTTEVIPDLLCAAKQNQFKLVGTMFIKNGDALPTVTATPKEGDDAPVDLTPSAIDNCVALPGTSGMEACTELTVDLPEGTLNPGDIYRKWGLVVTNPDPVGCNSTDEILLTMVPDPELIKIDPEVICTAQGDNTITVTGKGFLTIDGVTPTLSFDSNTFETTPSDCTDIPADEGANGVMFPAEAVQSCTTLTITIKQGELDPGTYRVTVTNPPPADCVTSNDLGFAVVPPPEINDITPDVVCPDTGGQEVTITGSNFVVIDGTGPSIEVGGLSITPTASDCTPVSGLTVTVETCTTLTATIPDTAETGLQDLVVTNPDPAGCVSTGMNIYISPPPTLTALQPSDICADVASTSVTLTGSDFLVIDGVAPTVTVGDKTYTPTASNCTPVEGLKEPLEVCTELTFEVLQNDLALGEHLVSVTNPVPAGCTSSNTLTLTVSPPPTITSVLPTKICVGGGDLTITGTNFLPGATVTLDGTPAETVIVNPEGTQITAVFGASGLTTGGPYDVTVSNSSGCSDTMTAVITVVPGPQLFFADPPVVYNGIGTLVTLYGSGFTGSVQFLGIRPAGTNDAPTALSFSMHPTNPNRLQALIPQGTAAGVYDFILRDQTTCDAVLLNGIEVVDQLTFDLVAIDPPFGHTGSSTPVTVLADTSSGGGFQQVPRLYLNPTTGNQAAGLVAVDYLAEDRVTAVVPAGLAVDTYDLIAVNPDGGVALLEDAFQVTQLPPPTLTEITPGSVANTTSEAVTVKGSNFRQPSALLRCREVGSTTETQNIPAVSSSTDTEVNLDVNASAFTNGAVCVVRIINGDDDTYGELSALVVTNPAQNLSTFNYGPSLSTGRRALAAAANRATTAARFLYVMGGDDGTDAGTIDTVEVAPVDIFGTLSDFFTQANTMTTPRSYISAAILRECIYLAGGFDGTAVLSSVERACVLNPEDSPEIVDLDLTTVTAGGLDPGLWYYRVSAVMPSTHVNNPNGETLASEPFPLLIPTLAGQTIDVTIRWSQVPGAAGYRIYRSPLPGSTSNEVRLIATVTGETTTQYTDSGDAVQAEVPLRLGATGVWHVVGTMATPRQGAGVTIGPDPADSAQHYLYVFGGSDGTTTLDTHEVLPISIASDGSQNVTTFTSGTATLASSRWQLGAFSVGNTQAAYVTPGTHYIYAGGGVGPALNQMRNEVDAFEIQAGGDLGAAISVDKMAPGRAGYGYAAANNFLYVFGGTQAQPNTTVTAAKLCSAATCAGDLPPELENWNNASANMNVSRYLMGSAVQSGFIYIVGGQTDTEAATASIEFTIW